MSHFGDGKMLPCVAGGVALGAAIALSLAHVWQPAACKKAQSKSSSETAAPSTVGDCVGSGLWAEPSFAHPPDTPAGFRMRQAPDGFDTMLE